MSREAGAACTSAALDGKINRIILLNCSLSVSSPLHVYCDSNGVFVVYQDFSVGERAEGTEWKIQLPHQRLILRKRDYYVAFRDKRELYALEHPR